MGLTKENVLAALRTVKDPEAGEDLVTLDAVRRAAVCEDHIGLTIALPTPGAEARDVVRAQATRSIKQMAQQMGAAEPKIEIEFVVSAGMNQPAPKTAGPSQQPTGKPQDAARRLENIRHVIAVGAGKGGVGKSTVSVNLAVGLARAGHAVGLMDGDIYGPSIPTLMGLGALEPQLVGNMIQPFLTHGVKSATLGKLVDPERPLIWRGPMAHGAFRQLVDQTAWGDLDYLVIDLPPGTGDVPLTMAQNLALDGAVIVCTPQKVAQDDAVRAARMFQQLGVEVLGVVENMSYFIGDDGKEYDIFERGSAEMMAQRLGLPFLGRLPIHMELRANSDNGDATANFEGNDQLRDELEALTGSLEKHVAMAHERRTRSTPTLSVS